MGNVQSGGCCGSYKVKQPEADLKKTEKKKIKSIESSQVKSTQVTESSLTSLNKKKVPVEDQTKDSPTAVPSNNQIGNKMSTSNHSMVRNSIGENIKILVKVQKLPLSQINTDSNITKREEHQQSQAKKIKQSKPDDSPNKIIIRKEDFARELRNTDISGFYLPAGGPAEKFYESSIHP